MSKPKTQQSRARDTQLERQAEFLDRYSQCGSILQACQEVGVDRTRHYAWLVDDDTYRERFAKAKHEAVDALEARVFLRANVESDRLAEFLLKGLRPEVYGDRFKAEHSGPDGKPIQTETSVTVSFELAPGENDKPH